MLFALKLRGFLLTAHNAPICKPGDVSSGTPTLDFIPGLPVIIGLREKRGSLSAFSTTKGFEVMIVCGHPEQIVRDGAKLSEGSANAPFIEA